MTPLTICWQDDEILTERMCQTNSNRYIKTQFCILFSELSLQGMSKSFLRAGKLFKVIHPINSEILLLVLLGVIRCKILEWSTENWFRYNLCNKFGKYVWSKIGFGIIFVICLKNMYEVYQHFACMFSLDSLKYNVWMRWLIRFSVEKTFLGIQDLQSTDADVLRFWSIWSTWYAIVPTDQPH